MQIIPVLDLKDRTVVRAHMGQRELLQADRDAAVAEPAIPSTSPAVYCRLPFKTIYVADLDAIEGRGNNDAALGAAARRRFPASICGSTTASRIVDRARRMAGMLEPASLVLGSESQSDARMIRDLAGDPRIVLSLDFRGAAFAGPPELLAEPGVLAAPT